MVVTRGRGVPANLINVIKRLHVGAQSWVREAGQFSEAFPLQMGLKQGMCSLLIFLCNRCGNSP